MRSQTERLIDVSGLSLSVTSPIVVLTAFHDFTNPPLNYYESGIDGAVKSMLLIGFILLLMLLQTIALLHRDQAERLRRNRTGSIVRLLIPVLILCAFLLNYNPFPGVSAPVEVRQRWAMREFHDFNFLMKSIQQCPAMVDRVGKVDLVAPTQGRNYIHYDPGSSGHQGELTLEVIGETGTGIANFKFYIGSYVAAVRFTQQGKTEKINCDPTRRLK